MMPDTAPSTIATDIAIIGSGAAGLMAAIRAAGHSRDLDITVVSKGAVARSGCSIMTLGFNAAVGPDDSVETHFADLVRRGEFLNDQQLAWTLASAAPEMIDELGRYGCSFDRTPDGALTVLPFAGQSVDRHVARREQTGLEIMSRLRDQVLRLEPRLLEDVRALDLLRTDSGEVTGVVLLDMPSGEPIVLRSRVVVMATGGAATIYRVASPAREKTGDGLAMCLRAGAELRDMEMMQFLSVGLAAGQSRISGLLLSEKLRFGGGRLTNVAGHRFMVDSAPEAMEAAGLEQIVRASYTEIIEGRGWQDDGVLLDVSHLGADVVMDRYPELVERSRLAGHDLTSGPVPVAPTSHFQIGGVLIDVDCQSTLPGLLVAGEDAGGVHGAAWNGGNGIAESTVFGARAGDHAARLAVDRPHQDAAAGQITDILERHHAPLARDRGTVPAILADRLKETMWDGAGPVRTEAGLRRAAETISELRDEAARCIAPAVIESNPRWQEALDVANQIDVAAVVVQSALVREETRGVHFRNDHPDRDDAGWLRYIVARADDDRLELDARAVALDRITPEQGEDS
jgi:succinate dehydrogenase / fumarate reductase flavoprotein subunit/fumarate reductase flavoprotein subunit